MLLIIVCEGLGQSWLHQKVMPPPPSTTSLLIIDILASLRPRNSQHRIFLSHVSPASFVQKKSNFSHTFYPAATSSIKQDTYCSLVPCPFRTFIISFSWIWTGQRKMRIGVPRANECACLCLAFEGWMDGGQGRGRSRQQRVVVEL